MNDVKKNPDMRQVCLMEAGDDLLSGLNEMTLTLNVCRVKASWENNGFKEMLIVVCGPW